MNIITKNGLRSITKILKLLGQSAIIVPVHHERRTVGAIPTTGIVDVGAFDLEWRMLQQMCDLVPC